MPTFVEKILVCISYPVLLFESLCVVFMFTEQVFVCARAPVPSLAHFILLLRLKRVFERVLRYATFLFAVFGFVTKCACSLDL